MWRRGVARLVKKELRRAAAEKGDTQTGALRCLLPRGALTGPKQAAPFGPFHTPGNARSVHATGDDVSRVDAAVYLVLTNADGDVLLMRQDGTGFQDGAFCLPCAKKRSGESIRYAAVRQAHEELGLALREADLDIACMVHRPAGQGECFDFYLRPRTWRGPVTNMEPHKVSEIGFYDRDSFPAHTAVHVRHGIECSLKGPSFAEFGWRTHK